MKKDSKSLMQITSDEEAKHILREFDTTYADNLSQIYQIERDRGMGIQEAFDKVLADYRDSLIKATDDFLRWERANR